MKRLNGILLVMSIWLAYCDPFNVQAAAIVDVNRTYSYGELTRDLEELSAIYPIQTKVIGRSSFGNNLYAVKLGNGKKNILIVGAHHGREWLTSSLLMNMLEHYAHAYHKQRSNGGIHSSLLDDVAIWFVPMLNVDGVEIQQGNIPPFYADQLYKMNDYSANWKRWKANGIGIDLNRQYPAGWHDLKRVESPHYQFYQGTTPVEAREVQALLTFTNEIKPLMAASYHSSGQVIYWHYKNGRQTKRDRKIAQALSRTTGYELDEPPKQAIGAGFTDWFITHTHRPGFTIEICPLVEETSPPLSCLKKEWEKNRMIGFILAKEAQTLDNNE